MSKKLIKNTILYDTPKYLKQRVVNSIVENNIGTYSPKAKPELIQLTNKSIDDKIIECINKEAITIKIIDLLEINKGYRYTVLFNYDDINMDELKNECIDMNSEYYNSISDSVDDLSKLYLEDDEHIFIKFHTKIKVLEKGEAPKWQDVRYPILFVFHKKLGLFEARFDRLKYESDRNFYKTLMDTNLYWLHNKLNINWSHINMDSIIREIVDNHKDMVDELIWAGELSKSKNITLKVGQDNIMPFFGELKIEIEKWKDKYKDKKDALDCLNDLDNYLEMTKKYANEKFRTLRWIKYSKNGKSIELDEPIDLRVTFNYSETMIDLINIYDNELNDMERIDYVVNFIGEIRNSIK